MADMQNTETEQTAVDEGVQAEMPQNARWHRRQARFLMIGKKGLTHAQKVERMEKAADHLAIALGLMDAETKDDA